MSEFPSAVKRKRVFVATGHQAPQLNSRFLRVSFMDVRFASPRTALIEQFFFQYFNLGDASGTTSHMQIVECVILPSVPCSSPSTPQADAVCSNGIAGVQATSVDVCCVEACGQCGGPGCDPGNSSTLTAADCCSSEIEQSGVLCDVTGTAPCIITTGEQNPQSID